jgi:hypothetical protein
MCLLSTLRKVNSLKGQKTAGGTLSQDSPSIKSKKKKKKAHL